jgi:DNA invertase Pin-like site-specific DNA recombinase
MLSFSMATKNSKKINTTKAIGYLRVSTDDQALSPIAQRTVIEAWAKRNGVTIVSWHEDHVSGAAALDKRPALLAAIEAIADQEAGYLVVAKRDRLARDVVASAMIERLTERKGARVISASGEGTDSNDPQSQLMRGMIDLFAQYERQIIRARTKAALSVKKARSERIGTVPFGYTLSSDGRTLVLNPAEQAVITKVCEGRANGFTLKAIVDECHNAGFVGRTEKPLQMTQIANILKTAA